jgi:hypothetical protein
VKRKEKREKRKSESKVKKWKVESGNERKSKG